MVVTPGPPPTAPQAGATTNTYVHEQPWKAIGVGAAAAFLLGLLVARRR